jgi:predicted site-specific integrase-resolvase
MAVAARSAQKMTVDEVCAELQIARSTFYDWRQKGRGPLCIRLPNGSLRITVASQSHGVGGKIVHRPSILHP